jgi:hypothetical protein
MQSEGSSDKHGKINCRNYEYPRMTANIAEQPRIGVHSRYPRRLGFLAV